MEDRNRGKPFPIRDLLGLKVARCQKSSRGCQDAAAFGEPFLPSTTTQSSSSLNPKLCRCNMSLSHLPNKKIIKFLAHLQACDANRMETPGMRINRIIMASALQLAIAGGDRRKVYMLME